MSQIKQVRISDAIRRFADAVEDGRHEAVLAKVDPAKVHLANMLVSLGRFASALGWDIRGLSQGEMNDLANADRVPRTQVQVLADQLRRFADAVDRSHAKLAKVDPGYHRLGAVCRAIALYARWIGADVGLGSGKGIVLGRPMRLPKLPEGL